MPTVTPILRTSKRDRKGQCPIWLRISDRDGSRFVSLAIKVRPAQWNPNAKRVRKGHPNADLINQLISERLIEAERAILTARLDNERPTAETLKETLASEGVGDFYDFAERHLEGLKQRGRVGRYRRLRALVRKLRAFTSDSLPFDCITPQFLSAYETHRLGLGRKQTTVGTDLSDLRAIYRHAIREGIASGDTDPFRRFSIDRGRAAERVKLARGEVESLEALNLDGEDFGQLARDVFLFAFYAGGIRFADVATMRQGRVLDGEDGTPDRLVYRAGKTGKRGSVKITPPARRILERYLGHDRAADTFIFPLLDGYDLSTEEKLYNAKSSRNAAINRRLKALADEAGITEADGTPKAISMHVARHSFADLARSAGWSVFDISKALQHASISMTERYLASFDDKALDARMNELFGETTNE